MEELLQQFGYDRAPRKLRRTAKAFCRLAVQVVSELPTDAARCFALRSLLDSRNAILGDKA